MPPLAIHRLGLIPYEEAWRLQERLAAEIAAGTRPHTLLLLEHPHVYTFGRSGKAENLLWDADELARREVSVHWVDRGGDVTYHGPGQLVGYPLVRLAPLGSGQPTGNADPTRLALDHVAYLRQLEAALIRAVTSFGVKARRAPGLTGVWVREVAGVGLKVEGGFQAAQQKPSIAKLAAIGVKVDVHGVTRHGFALNVAPDMAYWDGIIGCGLKGYAVTSLSALLDPAPAMDAVMDAVETAFGEVFGLDCIRGADNVVGHIGS